MPCLPRIPPLVVAFVLVPALAGLAGDYHRGKTLICSDCHTGSSLAASVGNDVNRLCLECHDGSTRGPDVLGSNSGRFAGDVRQAGSLSQLGLGSEHSGHTLGSTEVAPGSSPPWSAAQDGGLTCTHCHDPHGSASYRNLRLRPGNAIDHDVVVGYNAGTPGVNDLRQPVFERHKRSYDERDVDFNEPDRRGSAYAEFCAACHDQMHGAPGDFATVGGRRMGASSGAFVRHPTAGVDVGGGRGDMGSNLATFGSRHNRVKVMSDTGSWDPPANGSTPSCMSCHKAHGNGNAFGLIYRSGKGTLTEDGDSGGHQLEALCGQCHGEAGSIDVTVDSATLASRR